MIKNYCFENFTEYWIRELMFRDAFGSTNKFGIDEFRMPGKYLIGFRIYNNEIYTKNNKEAREKRIKELHKELEKNNKEINKG